MSNDIYFYGAIIGWVLAGIFFARAFSEKRRYARRRKKKQENHDNEITWYKGKLEEAAAKLAKRAARQKPQKEWHLLGVILHGIDVSGDRQVYAIVEFNPQTGELRAPPPEFRFFTLNGHDDVYWRQCGGGEIPRTLLLAPSWKALESPRAIPDLLMLGEVYHFRYGAPHRYIETGGTNAPALRVIEATEPGEARRIAS